MAIVETFGHLVNFNPHLHVLAAHGAFLAEGRFVARLAVTYHAIHDIAQQSDCVAPGAILSVIRRSKCGDLACKIHARRLSARIGAKRPRLPEDRK